MKPYGFAFDRKRGDLLPDEVLVNQLVGDFQADLKDLIQVFLPDGRPPFAVPLSRVEMTALALRATPPDWQGWLSQVNALPPDMRGKEAATLFKQWMEAERAKLGLGTQDLAVPEEVPVGTDYRRTQRAGLP